MNYYEHHIGDYAEATAHLSFIEDSAYSRLIRKYYATEKPLPMDQKLVQRLVGARSKEEREAVATVLDEFFNLQDDGWHNTRCDKEIANYKEGDSERQQKKSHEKERMRRHREERASLFAELRKLGITPKWDTPATELREMLRRSMNTPVTRTGAEQKRTSNAPATANQTPNTHTQSPNTTTHVSKDTQESGAPTLASAVCLALRAEGLSSVNPAHPELIALLDDGAEVQDFVNASRIARNKGKGFAYVIGILKVQRADAQRMAVETKTKIRQGANHDGHDVEEPA